MRTGRSRTAAKALLAIAVASLVVGGPLALGSKRHRSLKVKATMTMTHDDASGEFVGTLTSPQSFCVVERTVDLWAFGTSPTNSPVLAGTTKTDTSGHFAFHEPNALAGYYGATSPKATRRHAGRTFICMPTVFAAANF